LRIFLFSPANIIFEVQFFEILLSLLVVASLLSIIVGDGSVLGLTTVKATNQLLEERFNVLLLVNVRDCFKQTNLVNSNVLLFLEGVDAVLDNLNADNLQGIGAESDSPLDVAGELRADVIVLMGALREGG